MEKKDIKKVVLAYSGGLDTSIIIPWLKENYNNCEVIAVAANVGQADELEGLEEKRNTLLTELDTQIKVWIIKTYNLTQHNNLESISPACFTERMMPNTVPKLFIISLGFMLRLRFETFTVSISNPSRGTSFVSMPPSAPAKSISASGCLLRISFATESAGLICPPVPPQVNTILMVFTPNKKFLKYRCFIPQAAPVSAVTRSAQLPFPAAV